MKNTIKVFTGVLALAMGVSTACAQDAQVRDFRTDKMVFRLTCRAECTAKGWTSPKTIGQGPADVVWKGGMVADGVDESGNCGHEHVIFASGNAENVFQLTNCRIRKGPKGAVGKLVQTGKNGKTVETWLFKK